MKSAVIIVDNGHVAVWQATVLRALAQTHQLHLFNCTNTSNKRSALRHGLYYAINVVSLRNRLSRGVDVATLGLRFASSSDFASDYQGMWQSLRAGTIAAINEVKPEFILKFGMNLLRVPPGKMGLPPILSYHHGDPEEFRGRPAGFYELLQGCQTVGQIIQILSNKLDGGVVVARGWTKTHAHSYKRTSEEALEHSPSLMRQALSNLASGEVVPISKHGPNYRLPSNLTVVRFLLQRLAATLRRLWFGAFVEKRWQVSLLRTSAPVDQIVANFGLQDWQTLPIPEGYTFLADPFAIGQSSDLLVEALRASDGMGELLRADDAWSSNIRFSPVLASTGNGHISFPAGIADGEDWMIIPETADWSLPRIYRLEAAGMVEVGRLQTSANEPVIDPLLHRHEGRYYLFGNCFSSGSHTLRLWHADTLYGLFEEHPSSPLRIDPDGSRMAGMLIAEGDRLYRSGQDFRGNYGDGLTLFEITRLGPDSYRERRVAHAKFVGKGGPHTLNLVSGGIVFDWYDEKFSFGAGFRRLRARLKRRRPTAA